MGTPLSELEVGGGTALARWLSERPDFASRIEAPEVATSEFAGEDTARSSSRFATLIGTPLSGTLDSAGLAESAWAGMEAIIEATARTVAVRCTFIRLLWTQGKVEDGGS